MPIVTGKAVNTYLQFQSAFATYPSGAWTPVSLYATGLGERRDLVEDPVLGRALYNGRDPNEPAPTLPVVEGPVEAALCLRELGWWLKGMFGAPVTTGTTDKIHTFESGKADLPAFTLQHKLGATDWRYVRGCKIDTLDVRAEKADGFARVSLGLIGRDEALGSAALPGTISAAVVPLRPAASRPIVRWNGVVAGDCVSAAMSVANGLERLPDLNGSEYPGDIDPGPVSISGDLNIRYRDQVWAALAAAETVAPLEIEWAMPGALAATRAVIFKLEAARIARQAQPIQGPGVVTQAYRFAAQLSATKPALTIILKNDVASY